MSNVYIFTHSDLDGAASAIILKLIYGNQLKDITFCTYNTIDKELATFLAWKKEENLINNLVEQVLLITDISPNDKTLKMIGAVNYLKPILLDHHKTREKSLSNYDWATFDNSKCGAELVLDFVNTSNTNKLGRLFPETEEFVKAISAWDLWKVDSEYRERGKQLNNICSFIGLEEFVDVFSKNINADKLDKFQSLLKYLENNKVQYIYKIIKEQLRKTENCMDGLGQTFKILFASEYISELGNAALDDEDAEDLRYVVIVNPLTNTISFRSREEDKVDTSIIAKMLGGGGHKAASDAVIDLKSGLRNKISKILNDLD